MPLNLEKVKSVPPRVVSGDAESFAGWVLSPPYRGPEIGVIGVAGVVEARTAHGHGVRHGEATGLGAVLFDLDGVLVDTARFHYLAWKRLAEELGVEFDETANLRFRGVGRMECLDMLLGEHGRFFAIEEKRMLAERKNSYYLDMVRGLGAADLAHGARELARELHTGGVKMGLVSASCNARLVLRLLGISGWFDAIVDGTEVRGKKEGFLRAAERMHVSTANCVVVEDAEAGARGAREAGMKCVGIGEIGADSLVAGLRDVGVEMLRKMVKSERDGIQSAEF